MIIYLLGVILTAMLDTTSYINEKIKEKPIKVNNYDLICDIIMLSIAAAMWPIYLLGKMVYYVIKKSLDKEGIKIK